MGPVSLLLRAPAVALTRVADDGMFAEYRAGAFVCVLAAGAFAVVLARRMLARGATLAVAAVVVLIVVAGPVTYDALFYGHPEEPLGAALCVAAVLAARDARPVLAGVLLGLAVATKQWAIIAAAPAFLAAPADGRARLTAVAVAVAALLTLPPVLANVSGYLEMQKMAAGAGGHLYLLRARGRPGLDPLALLALVFLLRCLLDPLSTIYYHAPFLLALLAWEAERRGRVPLLTLLASASLWCVWRSVALLDLPALTNAVYLAWALPMAALLTAHAFGLSRGRLPRAAGVPSAQAVQA
jgi:uncharacterized membrane protein